MRGINIFTLSTISAEGGYSCRWGFGVLGLVKAIWMVLKEVLDFSNRQCVILRYVDMSDVVLMDTYIIMLIIIK